MRKIVLFFLSCALFGCQFRGIRASFEVRGPVPTVGGTQDAEFLAALFQTTGARLLPGHRWMLEPNGQVFSDLERDISQARISVNFDEYIWEPGRASEKLLHALAGRSPQVGCRVLADALGSPDFEAKVAPRLRAIGCEARIFRPVTRTNLFERNHRKLVVIDGRIAYLGGFGVRDDWLSTKRRRWSPYRRNRLRMTGEWRDDNIRIVGPVSSEVQRAFAQNWQEAGGALLPAAEFPVIAPDGPARVAFVSSSAGYLTEGERLIHLLIRAARKRVHIANAYFVPDPSLLKLLAERARAGIEVRVLAPGQKNDVPIAQVGQRQVYKELRSAGVQIFEYQPEMMHAKIMVVDDRLAMIGSLNMNLFSLNRLEEAVFVIEDSQLVQALDQSFHHDLEESREIE